MKDGDVVLLALVLLMWSVAAMIVFVLATQGLPTIGFES
jgi:hypothetical protein